MLDGNRFFPLTGTPIWKMARINTAFAVWLPEPLTVATWMLKSLTTGFTAGLRGTPVAGGSRHSGVKRQRYGPCPGGSRRAGVAHANASRLSGLPPHEQQEALA